MKRLTTAGIIACYNQEKYIAESVESLAGQVDELVVINDFSSDNSADVLNSLGFENLRVIHNTQQLGVSLSYNKAVDSTEADLLLIQGGDDRSMPQRAERQANSLVDPEVALVYSLPRIIDANGRTLPDSVAGEFLIGRKPIDPLEVLYFGANFVCAPAVALRRADYLRHGGFKLGLDLLQDFELWLLLAAEGRFAVLDEPIVEYRKHSTNLSREAQGLDSPKQRRFLAEQDYIRENFVARAADKTIRRLAKLARIDEPRIASLDREEILTLIQLAHPDRLVVRHGLRSLFAIAGSGDGQERIAKMGLSSHDFTDFSVRSDHENFEGVGQALAAVRTLHRLTGSESQ